MWQKLSSAIGSALVDDVKSQAAATPTAPVAIGNIPAPGQKGPVGMSPRTTYSRTNTGAAQTPSLGDAAKTEAPRGAESLPKVAHKEISMAKATMMRRPDLQELVKSAAEGTINNYQLMVEAARQLGHGAPSVKEASAPSEEGHIPTEVCEKYASALEYLAKVAADPGSAEEASRGVGPGQGPGASDVLVSNRTEENVSGQMGQAQAAHVVPKNPGFEQDPGKSSDTVNAMATNDDMMHGEQPVDPMGNAHASNAAQKQASANLEYLLKIAAGLLGQLNTPAGRIKTDIASTLKAGSPFGGGMGGASPRPSGAAAVRAAAGGAAAGGAGVKIPPAHPAQADSGLMSRAMGAAQGSIPRSTYVENPLAAEGQALRYKHRGMPSIAEIKAMMAEMGGSKTAAANLLYLMKIAEDAINPAHISAGPASAQGAEAPDGVSASQEGPVPPMPSPANSQASLVGSNDAAIAYTKRDAKANMRADMAHLLSEPMQAASGDSVLQKTLDHTGGAKIAHLSKTAAAQALLLKLAQAQEMPKKAKGKEKSSQMGGGGNLSTPQGQSGFSAANMG